MSHALLSPSSAHRWLTCTPSARLETQFPDRSSEAADEGTLAHKLGELLIAERLKMISATAAKKIMAEVTESKFYNEQLHDYCEAYAEFVIEQYNEAKAQTKDALIFLETKLDLTDYAPESFGTGDAVIIANGVLRITDLKFGKGVLVNANENKQLKIYGLGAYEAFGHLYDIEEVHMTIYQPRIDNISTFVLPVKDLLQWANTELAPKAKLAFAGEGEFIAGDHCRFCKAKASCRANANQNLELAKHEFKEPPLLTEAEVSEVMSKIESLTTWANAVEEYALDQAVNHGKHWPGFKLVEGRSVRKYKDEKTVSDALLLAGYNEETYMKKELLGLTALEKAIGKAKFAELVSVHLIKPPGKLTLVPLSDKRPAYDSNEAAKSDFAE